MNKKDLIEIRPFRSDPGYTDQDFIEATWLQGLYNGNGWFKEIDKKTYYEYYRKIIQKILEKSQVSIACLKEDPATDIAYAVMSGSILHWVYCKHDWRGLNLMGDLISPSVESYSHTTPIGKSILKKKYPNAIFNPFIF